MLPAGPLMIEHRLIERMITAVKKEAKRLEDGGELDVKFLEGGIDFFRTYADRCHHGKEEDILFAKLAYKSMTPPMRQAMERLKEEHATARSLVRELSDLSARYCAGDRKATREIARVLDTLARIYPDHIAREDKEFFPTAMTYLDQKERDDMLEAFEEFEQRIIHDKYNEFVQGAEKR